MKKTCSNAVENGHLECLKYGKTWKTGVVGIEILVKILFLAVNGHTRVFEILRTKTAVLGMK